MRVYLRILYLVAILGPTWLSAAQAQLIAADDQPKLDGAVAFVEQFVVRRVVEAISVDATQWASFQREPGTEAQVWSLTGTAMVTDVAGHHREHAYSARLEVLCDDYKRTGCWTLKTLTLGKHTFSGTSATVVAMADLAENAAPETGAARPETTSAQPASQANGAAPSKEEDLRTLAAATDSADDGGRDIGWLQAMAEKGDPAAQYQLAERYRIGFPVEQDTAKAIELYKLSAGQGFASSQFRLGELYEEGKLVQRDLGKAIESYRAAAEQGHAGAQYALAHIYHLGSGVPQDMAKAMVWYRKAALQGDEWSQLALGDQYRIGLAVPRDLVESTKWYRMAADQGNIFAQYELGNAYRYGNGVDKDLSKAIAWYKSSAAAGNPSANMALTELRAGDAATAGGSAGGTAQAAAETPKSDGPQKPETPDADGVAASDAAATSSNAGQVAMRAPEPDKAAARPASPSGNGGAKPGSEVAFATMPTLSDDETVRQLLILAKDQVAKLALTTPAGDNAYETYQLILSIQPNNATAHTGIRQIGAKYATLAEAAQGRGRTAKAQEYIGKALKLAPDQPEVRKIAAALKTQDSAAPSAAVTAASSAAVTAASSASVTAAPSAAGTAVAVTPPKSSAGATSPGGDIQVSALTGLPGTTGNSSTAPVSETEGQKPELLTSGLLYAVSGLDAQQVGNYKEAIDYYTLAIKAGDLPDKSLAYVHNNRGASYRNLSLYDQAIEDYDEAIRLNPDYATAFYNRGIAYDRKGFHELAIDDFDTAIRLKPDFSDAYNQRGLAYASDGHYDVAIENFSQAIRLDPKLDSAYFNRGLAYHSKGEVDRAAADLRKSHDLAPDNPDYGKKMKELGIL